jgi:predicted unusual protein kinase regulating ubiquinone biosynthesis (AarF/ABC1/UbiB family)
MPRESRLTTSRIGRLGILGRLAGGIAGGVVTEGARHLAQGKKPRFEDLLLTPANARRLADRLAEMRGAAMKVGQLLSMDSGSVLPRELSQVLDRLREQARPMPLGQVAQTLRGAWGDGWETRFARFHFTPIAAASIGQVHAAELRDGRRIAVKLQYPGIRRSIDSDVDNVAGLLRLFKLLPEQLEVAPLFDEAKRQLHAEADYRFEAESIGRFARRLAGDDRFGLPEVIDELSGPDVLTMGFLAGRPIESLSDAPAAQRDRVAADLLDLTLREVYDWGLVQTDPNFANYLYDEDSGRVQLLDFGATRTYDPARVADLRGLLGACIDERQEEMVDHATRLGYLADDDLPRYRERMLRLIHTATEPARTAGDYDFADATLAHRMREQIVELRLDREFSRMPPVEILFLHRKLAGLYLMLARLQARIPVQSLVTSYLAGEPPLAATA